MRPFYTHVIATSTPTGVCTSNVDTFIQPGLSRTAKLRTYEFPAVLLVFRVRCSSLMRAQLNLMVDNVSPLAFKPRTLTFSNDFHQTHSESTSTNPGDARHPGPPRNSPRIKHHHTATPENTLMKIGSQPGLPSSMTDFPNKPGIVGKGHQR